LGATLKLYLMVEIFIQNDSFKKLNKEKIMGLHKVLTMALQEREVLKMNKSFAMLDYNDF
jgi:hypothetical protein